MYALVLCLVALCTLVLGTFYSAFGEWLLHKYLMHRPLLGFTYPYKAHAQTHHREFEADHTYHLQEAEKAHLIRMAWWNWIALVPLATAPVAAITAPLIWTDWWAIMPVICTSMAVGIFGYYCAYEYLHWCMHDPKNRWFERTNAFRYLDRHHFLHHEYEDKNFNVVFPLADWLLGTLVIRHRTLLAA